MFMVAYLVAVMAHGLPDDWIRILFFLAMADAALSVSELAQRGIQSIVFWVSLNG